MINTLVLDGALIMVQKITTLTSKLNPGKKKAKKTSSPGLWYIDIYLKLLLNAQQVSTEINVA